MHQLDCREGDHHHDGDGDGDNGDDGGDGGDDDDGDDDGNGNTVKPRDMEEAIRIISEFGIHCTA